MPSLPWSLVPVVRRRRRAPGRGPSPVAAVALAAALLAGALPPTGGAQEDRGFPDAGARAGAEAEVPAGGVIVALKDGADPAPLLRRLGVRPTHVYKRVFAGFAADLPPAALRELRRAPEVELVSPDAVVFITAQEVPTGVDRVDADRNPRAGIDGRPEPVDADIAVLDTGIDRHPDLNLAGGAHCVAGHGYADDNGHGTHVAGIAAAEDNNLGVVGVAPGARLWAVKVLNQRGFGRNSNVVCGLEWVLEHGRIDVVNMSLGAFGRDGSCRTDTFHRAVCAVVEAGIPVVVAAGNEGQDVDRIERRRGVFQMVPAAWEETIAVSSFNDYDGRPGGAAEPTCVPERFREFYPDDTFTRFSNFGPDVDVAAPGVCIRSTWNGGGYRVLSGTSMAAPHVAGAVALYRAERPGASVVDVRSWLRGTASVAQGTRFGFAGDPDPYREPVLYLGPAGGSAAGA